MSEGASRPAAAGSPLVRIVPVLVLVLVLVLVCIVQMLVRHRAHGSAHSKG